MFTALAEALSAGLSIWKNENSHKYDDKLASILKDYYEEDNKPESERSDAVLDNLKFELCIVSLAFSSEVRKQNIANK